MENLLYNFGQVLGITVLHSLWQGLLIWLVLRILFLSAPSLNSSKKHNLSFIALFSIAIWFSYTFYTEARTHAWNLDLKTASSVVNLPAQTTFTEISGGQNTEHVLQDVSSGSYKSKLYNTLKDYLPYISVLYAIGLVINLLNLLLGWNKILVIKQSLISAEQLQEYVNRLSRQLNIRKYIQVNYTEFVDVPCVIGYLKPVLLLPVTLTTQLSTAEIEAILLHEITHIKNNDYLLNILQQIISVLLFFNPFAQFINRIVSKERENKCDDMVVQTSIDPLIYAHALLKLEETRQVDLKLALAATGNRYNLLSRIERIMKAKKPMVNIRHLVFAIILFIGSLVSISWLNPEIKNSKLVSKDVANAIDKLASHMLAEVVLKEKTPVVIPVKDLKDNAESILPADTVPYDRISAIEELNKLGKKPLVLIDGKEYDPDILYRISGKSIHGLGVFPPRSAAEKAAEDKRGNTPKTQNEKVNELLKSVDPADQASKINVHKPSRIEEYGEKAKDGLIEISTGGEITYMDATERENIIKERSVPQNQFYTRITLKKSDGSLFDKVIIKRQSGGGMSTEIKHTGKVAFLIDGKIYSEEEIAKFDQSRINEISKSSSGGVGNAELYDVPGFDLSGYEAIFFFKPAFPFQKKQPVSGAATRPN